MLSGAPLVLIRLTMPPAASSSAASLALRFASVSPTTLSRYRAAFRSFLQYSYRVHLLPYGTNLHLVSPDDVDFAFSEWIGFLYVSGLSRHRAASARACLFIYRPSLRTQLPMSARTLRGWSRLRPPVPCPPISWELTVLIATLLVRTRGLGSLALGLLLAFHCMLRGSELANLRVGDIALPGDPRLGSALSGALLLLPRTKTGRDQSVPVRSRHLVRVLFSMTADRDPDELLLRRSLASIRYYFNIAAREAGLQAAHFSLHSLRAGGATYEFLRGMSVESILVLGRWRSTPMAAHYIRMGPARLAATRLPLSTLRLAQRLSARYLASLREAGRRYRASVSR